MMIKWPFTNLHTLNLDWLIAKMKELETKVKEYATNVSASATTGAPGSQASASVTGNLDEGIRFSFTIPTGAQGPQGPQGERGPAGSVDNIRNATLPFTNTDITGSYLLIPSHGDATVSLTIPQAVLDHMDNGAWSLLCLTTYEHAGSITGNAYPLLLSWYVWDNSTIVFKYVNPYDTQALLSTDTQVKISYFGHE